MVDDFDSIFVVIMDAAKPGVLGLAAFVTDFSDVISSDNREALVCACALFVF